MGEGVANELRGKEIEERIDVAWKPKRIERELSGGSGGGDMNIGNRLKELLENRVRWCRWVKIGQKVSEELNEGDNIDVSMGRMAGDELGASRINSGLDSTGEDVINMGLDLVLGPSGGQGGSVDSEKDLGLYNIE
ncbi:hypothetical protein J1N35_001981 [Gossypium stocksii]|uniref:Uncharacterized protein n=1 Tax=Gossypium stocksii TaxID=47602 RepID=A0A9D3WLC3_9ROSI|nr:hypothetical protein J1N35_001981 [Gossypium stocksii]